MTLHSLRSASLTGKRVLLRFDGDVPVQHGVIQDDFRLKAVLPTIRYCRQQGATVVLLAHRGRPKGMYDPRLSNSVLVPYLTEALGEKVIFIKEYEPALVQHPVVLLENLRFHRGEEINGFNFAKQLAKCGDVYCNDAFAVSHRAHASVAALASLLPHYAGFRLQEEVQALLPLRRGADEKPYVAVLGGAKASDKSPIIRDLVDKVDGLVIGGLVAITYFAAMGQETGAHPLDADQIKLAQQCIRRLHEEGVPFYLPLDIITQHGKTKLIQEWQKDDLMIDIGPLSRELFASVVKRANTIFWNGAMGKFEDPAFAGGTIAVAKAIGASEAQVRIASGGDTVSAIHQHRLASAFTFISTGGGATLEFIAGLDLPGLKALGS